MLIQREKYNIHIMAPRDMDLHDTKLVQNYIRDHIADRIRECCLDFVNNYGDKPKVIRLASADFMSLKDAIQIELSKDWISSTNLTLDDIKVKQTCMSGRAQVILDSELDEEVEDEE